MLYSKEEIKDLYNNNNRFTSWFIKNHIVDNLEGQLNPEKIILHEYEYYLVKEGEPNKLYFIGGWKTKQFSDKYHNKHNRNIHYKKSKIRRLLENTLYWKNLDQFINIINLLNYPYNIYYDLSNISEEFKNFDDIWKIYTVEYKNNQQNIWAYDFKTHINNKVNFPENVEFIKNNNTETRKKIQTKIPMTKEYVCKMIAEMQLSERIMHFITTIKSLENSLYDNNSFKEIGIAYNEVLASEYILDNSFFNDIPEVRDVLINSNKHELKKLYKKFWYDENLQKSVCKKLIGESKTLKELKNKVKQLKLEVKLKKKRRE